MRQELSREFVSRCIRDEGRLLGATILVEAPRGLKLLWTKAMVVSVKDTARVKSFLINCVVYTSEVQIGMSPASAIEEF